jgi:hypothetical protein
MSLISKRLDRLEERHGIGRTVRPVLRLINDSTDPDNAARLTAAAKFKRDNPDGFVIERFILDPPGCSPSPVASDETVH